MGRRKTELTLGKASIISTYESNNKAIELEIAKKRYEIDVLSIELRYPETKESDKPKI